MRAKVGSEQPTATLLHAKTAKRPQLYIPSCRRFEAVSIDPAEPFAYAGLALGYLEIAHGPLGTNDDLAKAEAAALQALRSIKKSP